MNPLPPNRSPSLFSVSKIGQRPKDPAAEAPEASVDSPPNPGIRVVHNRVANRLRLAVPLIRYKATFAEMLKQTLLNEPVSHGIYHAEPNTLTGNLLVKYHPAHHTESEVLRLVADAAHRIAQGQIEITLKHKNPRLSRMQPGAFFTRELLVSIGGNVIAGLVLAAIISA